MAAAELPNAARHHVHQDLLISNYFGRSFNEFGFHNWIWRESRGRRINPGPEENLFTSREIAAEKLISIIAHNCHKATPNRPQVDRLSSHFLSLPAYFLIPSVGSG